MFGNKDHARQVAEFARAHVTITYYGESMPLFTPDGFTYLGSGCNRHAFMRDGYVYKINTSDSDGNAREMEAVSILPGILSLLGGKYEFIVAPVFQYEFEGITVNVMEYFDGDEFSIDIDEDFKCAEDFEWQFPDLDYDIHPGNVIVVNGKNVLIDT
jgi:hypothetical protein